MSNALKFAACGGAAAPLYVDDVFSAYTYTGNSSTQTITNGIDLAGEGGLVWVKCRSVARSNYLVDTDRGGSKYISTDLTQAEGTFGSGYGFTFSGSGVSILQNWTGENFNGDTYASWTFRKAPNFFNHSSVTKSGGSNATASFPGLGTLGMVVVKRTDSTGSWYVWHRSLTAGKLLYLEQTAAEATLGHITVSGTTVTLVNGVITDGTYIVYAWAHDTEADGIIQCGTFTTDAGGLATVTLGWEPQYILMKSYSNIDDWMLLDSTRGWNMTVTDRTLYADLSNAEADSNSGNPTATGFYASRGASRTYIYLAIRRPNKPPTVGTQVYNAIARTGNRLAGSITGIGFSPDSIVTSERTSGGYGHEWLSRLTGVAPHLITNTTGSEFTSTDLKSIDVDGLSFLATDYNSIINLNSTLVHHFFRRAPGFFDEVCDTGTGSAHTVAHNLTVAPELMIRKDRSTARTNDWCVWHSALTASERLNLHTTAAKTADSNAWNATAPTASVFSVGATQDTNNSTDNYVTYLFATLAGISCVTSYTGDGGTVDSAGTSQTINCGFTTGARFVMLKCTSHTSDWVVVDTVRGLVSGNDPALSLNTTAAEVTTTDLLDPDSSGFIVNQLATGTTSANFNVTGRTYLVLAIA